MQKGVCPLELPARLVASYHAMSKKVRVVGFTQSSVWQMLSCSQERYSVYPIQIWLTETESALTAGHLTMFKLGSGKRPFQDGAMRIFGAPSTSSENPVFSN